ncbi:NAD(P)/FAD-dependent oxidoreductase [Kitasatospora sp. NPDC052896]|uniref:NAD(P)/FAD-dependent oxidoreductase n=1 Tax=Kitasatospora sp. NPDC052896 TaxID=3364061 RepID=UPI0037C77D08
MAGNAAFVVVGGGLAGGRAVETLRAEGYDGPLVLVTEEDERPYERPPLSKRYLLGASEREELFVHPPEWYAEHDVELRLGVAATELDVTAHEFTLSSGDRLGYRRLLLATGAAPRRLPLPGADLDGVFTLRRIADSEALRAVFAPGARVAVIGAGWIGLEVAAAARTAGAEVTVLEVLELPLLRVLGREAAEVFAELHRQHGVRLRFGVRVAEFVGSGGRVTAVRLADGTEVPADVVVVGVGAAPNDQLARAAGLVVDDGVCVDARLRSSDPDVFAAGDVANAIHPLLDRRVRVEHWANALNQAPVAARSMLGRDAAYDRLPYFFTDQYDLGMEYSGLVEPGEYDRVVFRGDVEGREFIAFWLADGRVLAGMNVNVWDVVEPIQDLIRSRRPVDPAALADPDVPLADLSA